MLRRTILGQVLTLFAPDFVSEQQRERIRRAFQSLASAPLRATEHPTLSFVHVPSPHAPWVFDQDGSPRTVADLEQFYAESPDETHMSKDKLALGYAGQMRDIDRRLLEALNALDVSIEARGRPAVTIVFSDHGSWIGAEDGDIRLRFKNLLAIRGTGLSASVESNQTLVNLLPNLFNQLFGAPWSRRPDTIYMFGQRDNYDFVPVDDPDAKAQR
jgi:hypothetical protein